MQPITYIIPTRNRSQVLERTLADIQALHHSPQSNPRNPHTALNSNIPAPHIIIIDNASEPPLSPDFITAFTNQSGFPTTLLSLNDNRGCAARNLGAQHATTPWIIMLDDDSYPTSLDFIPSLHTYPAHIAAVMADITLPNNTREAGGLPEVFTGCGVAFRRESFLACNGYDPTFHYYAEEYDLAAKLIAAGHTITFNPTFKVRHEKHTSQRDMNTILSRLVRNNAWVMQRYAPDLLRRTMVQSTIVRYRQIANRESALRGYREGLLDFAHSRHAQPRTPLSHKHWNRFIGAAAARSCLDHHLTIAPFSACAIIDRGKGSDTILQILHERGIQLVPPLHTDIWIIGTLSHGPAANTLDRLSVGSTGNAARNKRLLTLTPWANCLPQSSQATVQFPSLTQ